MGDDDKIVEAVLLRVPPICHPRGILRETFIKEELPRKYAELGYGDLTSDVAEITEGPVRDLLISLLSDRLDFEARVLHRAMAGLGADEDTLVTVLCTLDEADILPLRAAYADRYETSLEQAVVSETSGKLKRVLLLA